ncbi:MAG: translocation/assembly module TamB domain-containing protein [Lautropia sp.]|nr:translocation/assembly module TamB domain-containing protein [Lautropia sp.]
MASSAVSPPSAIDPAGTGSSAGDAARTETPPPASSQGESGRGPRPSSLGRRLFRWLIRVVLVLVLVLMAGLVWLGSESGLNVALSRAQQLLASQGQALAFEQLEGNLWRGIRLGRLEWRGANMMVKGEKFRLRWSLKALLDGRVAMRTLGADVLVVQLPPADKTPKPREDAPMPGDFGLPLSIGIRELDVKRLELWPADVDSHTQPPTPLLALDDIQARLHYTLGQYEIESLSLSSPWGHVESATAQLDAAPPHRLKAAIHADGTHRQWPYEVDLIGTGSLQSLALTLNGQLAEGQADVRAVLNPLNRMPLHSLHARIADVDLRRFVEAGALPETGLDLDLDIDPDSAHAGQWQGRLRVGNRLPGALADQRLPLRQLRTELQFNVPPTERWADAFFRLKNLTIGLPVSPVPASENTPGKTMARADARVAGQIEAWWGKPVQLPGIQMPTVNADLRIDDLDLAPWVAALPSTALKGLIQLDGERFLVDLVQTAAQMKALLPEHLHRLADNAQLKLAGSLDEELLRLREIKARLGESRFSGGGQVTVKAPHQLRVGGGLRNIDLARWVPADLAIDPAWREGQLGADWLVTGQLMAADGHQAELKLNLLDSIAAGQPLTGNLRLRPVLKPDWQLVSIEGVSLNLAHGQTSQIQAQGALGRPQDTLAIQTRVDRLGVFDRRLQGQVSLHGELKGKLDDLVATLQGQGQGVSIQLPGAEGEPPQITAFKSLALNLDAPLNLLKPHRAEHPMALRLGVQKLQLAGEQIDGITLNLRGQPREHTLGAVVDHDRERLQLNATGGVQHPRGGLQWQGKLDLLDISGQLGLRLNEAAPLTVDAERLDMGAIDLSVLGGKLKAEHLKLDWAGPLRFDTAGSLTGLVAVQLRQLLGVDEARNLEMLKGLRADALWALKGQGADALHGEVKLAIREEGTGLNRTGRLGLRRGNGAVIRFNGRALDGRLSLDLPSISLANMFLGADLSVDGRLKADGSVTGTLDQPKVDLALTGEGLTVLQRSAGMRLSGGELDAHLGIDGLRLKTLRFSSGEGSLNVSGAARLVERAGLKTGEALPDIDTLEAAARKRKGAATRLQPSVLPMDGQFDVVLDRFRVPVGPGQRVTVSGQTQLTSSAKGLFLGGGLKVDEGLIEIQGSAAPSLPDDVHINDTTVAGDAETDEDDVADRLRIASNLGVDLGKQLRVTGLGVDARLGGRLTLVGFLPSDPKLTGAVQVLDGSYEAYGQNLRITKGFVRFNGPIENPSLDIEATRPFLPVEVGISVTGQVAAPQVSLISKPSMPETTKLSWLVLGVPPEQAGGAAQMLALQQAGTLLLGDDGAHSPSIADRLGLDVFNYGYASDSGADQGLQESLAPKGLLGSSSGNDENTETGVVSLGKRINDRLFVSYEKGVRGVWSLLRIQYTLGRGFVLRGQTGSDNSVDVLRSISFD